MPIEGKSFFCLAAGIQEVFLPSFRVELGRCVTTRAPPGDHRQIIRRNSSKRQMLETMRSLPRGNFVARIVPFERTPATPLMSHILESEEREREKKTKKKKKERTNCKGATLTIMFN